jgi:hypothetical protein
MDWDAKAMHFHLLMMSIQEEPPGSIPDDMALIRRWLGSPSEDIWRRVRPQVLSAWTLRTDRWFNQGMVETFERKERFSKRYENGTKKGRESPENQENSNSNKELAFDVGSKKSESKAKTQPLFTDSDCEAIYKAYPRRVGKGDAIPAIKKALECIIKGEYQGNEVTAEEAIAGLKNRVIMFAQSAAGHKGAYTPHPASWFNKKRYLDDPKEWEDHGNGEINKAERRQADNLAALDIAFPVGRRAANNSR